MKCERANNKRQHDDGKYEKYKTLSSEFCSSESRTNDRNENASISVTENANDNAVKLINRSVVGNEHESKNMKKKKKLECFQRFCNAIRKCDCCFCSQ